MDVYKKIQIGLLVFLVLAVICFGCIMYITTYATRTGTFTSDDGAYIGEIKGQNFHGKGKFTSSTGVIYEGDWENGIMQGHGKMTYVDGSYYEGGFYIGYMHGKGKIVYPDGHVHEGEWIANESTTINFDDHDHE